jgi:hypothetical protein
VCQLIKRGKRNHRTIPKPPLKAKSPIGLLHGSTLHVCPLYDRRDVGRAVARIWKASTVATVGANRLEPPAVLSERGRGRRGATTHQRFPAFHPVPNSPATRSRHQRNSNNFPFPSVDKINRKGNSTQKRRAEIQNTSGWKNPTFCPSKTPPEHRSTSATRATSSQARPPSHPIAILVTRPEPGRDSPITHPTPRWAPRWPAGHTHWLVRGG